MVPAPGGRRGIALKRDLDLVRSILLRVEGADGALGLRDFSSDAYTDDVVAYHLQLMENRGLIDASFTKDWSGSVVKATIGGLTWEGADYLDAIRDDGLWRKTKDALARAGAVTFGAVKEVAVAVAVASAKASLGI